MITEIVSFSLPEGITRAELLEKYRSTAKAWSENPDLIQKYYFFDEKNNRGGGVYIWTSLEAAETWHGPEYQARIRDLYGDDLRMERHDTMIIVDNINGRLEEPDQA